MHSTDSYLQRTRVTAASYPLLNKIDTIPAPRNLHLCESLRIKQVQFNELFIVLTCIIIVLIDAEQVTTNLAA